jgi:hypothetical protein
MTAKAKRPRRLDFIVDKLTNSIENTLTGESVETEIVRLQQQDAAILRKLKWQFDWYKEFHEPNTEIHALIAKGNPSVWHGLVSSEDRRDHMFMHLIESAPFNMGRDKLFAGVMGNLVAFLCKNSFEKGYMGAVAFEAKTRLIEHYKKELGAQLFTPNRMFIDTPEAIKLLRKYFPNFDHGRDRNRF